MLNLTDIKTIKSILRKHNFRFSKSLGQNFLTDEEIPIRIANSANIDENIGVIEIGPGIGTLTAQLAKKAKKVVAIEIDKALLPILNETLNEFNNIKIINDDFLKIDVNKLIEKEFLGLDVVICANLPYYITTPIIMHILENKINAKRLIFMVQKEVALRLCAKPNTKDYGAITLAINYYTNSSILFDVYNSSFTPVPKVTSTVICLDIREKPPVTVINEKFLFSVIKASFSQRRKTFSNAICNSLGIKIQKEEISTILKNLELNENIRGEVLSLKEFACISDALYENI